jgi:hypothetical protein
VLARISGSVWPRRERRFMSNHSGIAAVQRGARRFSTHHAVQQRCRGKALACSAGRRCSSAGLRMCRRVNCKRRGTACSAGRRCSSAGLRMCRRVNCKRRGTACSAGSAKPISSGTFGTDQAILPRIVPKCPGKPMLPGTFGTDQAILPSDCPKMPREAYAA